MYLCVRLIRASGNPEVVYAVVGKIWLGGCQADKSDGANSGVQRGPDRREVPSFT